MSISDGLIGENIACQFVSEIGYRVIARNYRTRFGEIDIIAIKDNRIHFIEVKYRKNQGFGLVQEAVTKRKIERLLKTAKSYLYEKDLLNNDWQIDVLAIDKVTNQNEFIENIDVEGLDN